MNFDELFPLTINDDCLGAIWSIDSDFSRNLVAASRVPKNLQHKFAGDRCDRRPARSLIGAKVD